MDSRDASRTPTLSPCSTAPSTPPSLDKAYEGLHARDITSTQWRPSYHVMPPHGWMNDPCAPGYDPKTGTYYVSFQWNPNGNDWDNISWATATSPDMVSWKVEPKPSIEPDTEYDNKGVFTGCLINARDGSLTCAYTSVNALPIHHSIPHPRGCESLSLATSSDDGRTWRKIPSNPVLPCEPEGVDVTGWRDPYVAEWPHMSEFLNLDTQNTLFGIISGGVRDITPTSFLYSIDANDLSNWNYVGPLTNFGLNLRPSRWSGDLGRNWEVTNFLSLTDQQGRATRDFLIMGTEGCIKGSPATSGIQIRPTRESRGQLWMSGSLRHEQNDKHLPTPVTMTYDFGGHLDHGCLYAANSFFDAQAQKQVVWGWITGGGSLRQISPRPGLEWDAFDAA